MKTERESETTPVAKSGVRTRMMTDAERATMEMADVMKQWLNPCVREAFLEYLGRKWTGDWTQL